MFCYGQPNDFSILAGFPCRISALSCFPRTRVRRQYEIAPIGIAFYPISASIWRQLVVRHLAPNFPFAIITLYLIHKIFRSPYFSYCNCRNIPYYNKALDMTPRDRRAA